MGTPFSTTALQIASSDKDYHQSVAPDREGEIETLREPGATEFPPSRYSSCKVLDTHRRRLTAMSRGQTLSDVAGVSIVKQRVNCIEAYTQPARHFSFDRPYGYRQAVQFDAEKADEPVCLGDPKRGGPECTLILGQVSPTIGRQQIF